MSSNGTATKPEEGDREKPAGCEVARHDVRCEKMLSRQPSFFPVSLSLCRQPRFFRFRRVCAFRPLLLSSVRLAAEVEGHVFG
jgi:hypothetical protein